jgi:hypothetical protein
VPHLAPTDYLVAELTGPEDSADTQQIVLQARQGAAKPKGHLPQEYILRGPVPPSAIPGNYRLTTLTLHHSVGGGLPQDYSELPDLWIVIDPYEPSPQPPLPQITKAD